MIFNISLTKRYGRVRALSLISQGGGGEEVVGTHTWLNAPFLYLIVVLNELVPPSDPGISVCPSWKHDRRGQQTNVT